MYQITQGDTWLQFAFEAYQYRFRHIQRHHTGRGGKRYQTRTSRERNTDRETGMRVTTSTHGIRQQHTVQPAMDNTITRTQCNTATVHDEVRQRVVRLDINRLRISRSVTE
eukprot:RCo003891